MREDTELKTPLRGQNLIDKFIEEADRKNFFVHQNEKDWDTEQDRVEDQDDELEDDSYFTETLAKIYIKQQRYSKALEIIKKLSLKYPKKSAYFADQIREVEQMIINAKSK